MSKVKFKGTVNGQEYDCYDMYLLVKKEAIDNNNLKSCSEEWSECDCESECYCDKTDCCGCTKEVKDCSCEEPYPDKLRLLFDCCLNPESAYTHNYTNMAKGMTYDMFKNQTDNIRKEILKLDEYQLNEYLDDIDFILGILREDEDAWENEKQSLQDSINEYCADLNECNADLDINKRLQWAYTTFKRDAMETLKKKIADIDAVAAKQKEHQENQERLEKHCNCSGLSSKQEVEFRESDKSKEELLELQDAIGALNEAVAGLGKIAGFETKELLDDKTIDSLLNLFGVK